MRFRKFLFVAVTLTAVSRAIYCQAESVAGLTLIEAPSARAAALGETLTAVQDDIAGLSYNPATLASFRSSQASFLYKQGAIEDTYAQFMVGQPTAQGGWGASLATYDGGRGDLFDGTTTRQVTLQRDLLASIGFSSRVGRSAWGVAGKYLRSNLADVRTAHAHAIDAGLTHTWNSRFRTGVSFQNLGSKLQYDVHQESLPRLIRSGVAIGIKSRSTLFLDGAYHVNDGELTPAAGFETNFGPLAFRGGMSKKALSLGAGFLLSPLTLDYAFGFSRGLSATHKISLAMRFGEKGTGVLAPISSAYWFPNSNSR